DIPLLVEHFLKKYSQETAKHVDHVSKNTLTQLKRYPWPGNVRELENAIERAVVLSKSRTLRSGDFSFLSTSIPRKKTPSLREVGQAYILEVLEMCDWNITHAAKILGINRVTLHKKIDRSGLRTLKK
ncbi:MAG: sigma-54-dependent Fis family transcriptional regulator, partial [Deltaproteobacteria bacterium]